MPCAPNTPYLTVIFVCLAPVGGSNPAGQIISVK